MTSLKLPMFSSRRPKLTFPDEDDVILLEYICTDHSRHNIITRTHITHKEPQSASDCPVKFFQGRDTVEIKYPLPELAMKPITIYRDPFRQGKHKIVFCEVETMIGKPTEYNTRIKCKEIMDSLAEEEPWIGFEQEFYFVDEQGVPLDYKLRLGNPDISTYQQVGIGTNGGLEREIAECHLKACIYAGLDMYGMNRECGPSEWEYQTGPTSGISAADQLHVSRYILKRLAEMYDVHVTFWNPDCLRWSYSRSTLHLNFSTKKMREDNGIEHINKIVERLGKYPHEKLLKHYDLKDGADAPWRLHGQFYMPKHDKFVCKAGNKDQCSVRIPSSSVADKKGYIEERRISGEADPYDAIRAFMTAALFDENGL